MDLSDKAYVQMIDGRITGAWRGDEMDVDILNPSDEINMQGFGVSPLENSLEATTLLMVALNYNKNHFLSNWPDAFLILKGEFSPQGLQAFKNQIYAEVGPQGNTRLPVVPTGGADYEAELLKLRDSMTDMQFAQLVRMAICLKSAAYGMHPATLNFAPDQGASAISTIIASTDGQEAQIAMAQEEGFHSILDGFNQWFGRSLVRPWYDDLVMVWSVEDQPNEVQRIDLWTKKLAAGATIDEWRQDEGLEKLEDVTDGEMTGDYVNSPFFFQAKEMKMAAMQQEQAQQADADRTDDSGFTGGDEEEEEPPGPNGGAPKKKLVLARNNSNGAKPKQKAKSNGSKR